jgi:predicted DNA-binding ArsR family transcriptional regulator
MKKIKDLFKRKKEYDDSHPDVANSFDITLSDDATFVSITFNEEYKYDDVFEAVMNAEIAYPWNSDMSMEDFFTEYLKDNMFNVRACVTGSW